MSTLSMAEAVGWRLMYGDPWRAAANLLRNYVVACLLARWAAT